MRSALFLVALLCCVPSPTWAGDPSPEPSLCAVDAPACRKLAVGVAKLELTDLIHREFDLKRNGSFLCPEDNPNCCPPRLKPFCAETERDLLVDAQRQFHTSLAVRADCPWTLATCENYCGIGKPWPVYGDCSPPQFELPPFVDCPCGKEPHDFKPICVDKVCTRHGFEVDCNFFCPDDPRVFEDVSNPPQPETNLARHLRDQKVHLEAAELLREDLIATLEAVEAQIKELSQYGTSD